MCHQQGESIATLRKERITETGSKQKTTVLSVWLSPFSEERTLCEKTLQAVTGSLLNEIVIASSFKHCLQTLLENESEKENVFVLGDLLNRTELCHHDVLVIKGFATLAHQNLTVPCS